MKVKAFALAGAAVGSMFVASTAPAAFTGVSFEIVDLGADGGTTYRFYADFDDPTDQLLAVNGDSNIVDGALQFSTNTALQNDPLMPQAGLKASDFPFFGAAWDSWVTIGSSTFTLDNDYSPGFLGGDGVNSVILGNSWSQADNGGWFDANPTTAQDGGHVLIAQFTVDDVIGPATAGDINLSGVISYNPGGGPPSSSEAFSVRTPAPGALALLGLAGLAGTRRRRA